MKWAIKIALRFESVVDAQTGNGAEMIWILGWWKAHTTSEGPSFCILRWFWNAACGMCTLSSGRLEALGYIACTILLIGGFWENKVLTVSAYMWTQRERGERKGKRESWCIFSIPNEQCQLELVQHSLINSLWRKVDRRQSSRVVQHVQCTKAHFTRFCRIKSVSMQNSVSRMCCSRWNECFLDEFIEVCWIAVGAVEVDKTVFVLFVQIWKERIRLQEISRLYAK